MSTRYPRPNRLELSELVPCDMCEAKAGLPCRTRSGRRATWPHAARLNVVTTIWLVGFEEGVLDALCGPELAEKWLRPEDQDYLNAYRNRR